jgi:hypothetical protein
MGPHFVLCATRFRTIFSMENASSVFHVIGW